MGATAANGPPWSSGTSRPSRRRPGLSATCRRRRIDAGPHPAPRRDGVGCASPTHWATRRGSSRRGCWRCWRSTYPLRRDADPRGRAGRTGDDRQPARSRAERTFMGCYARSESRSPRPWGRASTAGSPRSPAAPSSPPASRCCCPRRSSRPHPIENDWGRGFLVRVPPSPAALGRPIDRAERLGPPCDRHDRRCASPGFAAGAGPLSPDVYWVRNRTWGPRARPYDERQGPGVAPRHGAPRAALKSLGCSAGRASREAPSRSRSRRSPRAARLRARSDGSRRSRSPRVRGRWRRQHVVAARVDLGPFLLGVPAPEEEDDPLTARRELRDDAVGEVLPPLPAWEAGLPGEP